jgi:hypothetical protein
MLSRISLLLLASCIAVPATFVGASAESIVSPRKKFNFSSRSFGSDDGFWSQRQRRQQRTRRNTRSFDFFNRNRGFFTTSDDERDFERQVRSASASRKRVRVTVDDGPRRRSTGEQYHAYKADALTRVIKADLKQPRPQGPVFAAAAGATVDVSDQLDVIELTDPVAQATFETLKSRR